MTATLLDFSRRRELALHAAVVADMQGAAAPLGVSLLIVGAFARDVHLLYGCGIPTQRKTADIDFALMLPDWAAFEALRQRLLAASAFSISTTTQHRLRHRTGLPVDLVPFGHVETGERMILDPVVERAAEWVRRADWLGARTTQVASLLGRATTPGSLPCPLCRA